MNSPAANDDFRPPLPRTVTDWLRVFGPGAIVASLTIGTGELVFSARGGALFGYPILFLFVTILLFKWGLLFATSRHMVLTGIHPYQRMMELPGPRGWVPIMLLLMAVVCLPIWISFHAGVIGNLTSWVTGTSNHYHGAVDYVWGASILLALLMLSASGGYSVLERVQMFVVASLVFCAALTLILYRPDWLALASGLVPRRLTYPDWLPDQYPAIARHSEWVETTRYVGVLGGAGFDYLAYNSWLRKKGWGMLPCHASSQQLARIAATTDHEVRRWLRAPLVDSTISFVVILVVSAVFVASGALFLGPEQTVPDERNLLSLQARFVTGIHPWLLPLYVAGAFLAMIGTLYGTIEVGCSIADEILRSFASNWTARQATRLRRGVIAWCTVVAVGILLWLFVRQSTPLPVVEHESATVTASSATKAQAAVSPNSTPPIPQEKPRLLLAILTPVNLFTGVLSCGLICVMSIWMDRRWLPVELQPSAGLIALNMLAAVVFLGIGIKGYWDNEHRLLVIVSMGGILVTALLVAQAVQSVRDSAASTTELD